ncbi:hypothetical protein Dimus_035749 [Dionaea muscipula]
MFDPGTELPPNRIHIFDPVGLICHDHCYGSFGAANYGVRSTRSTETFPLSAPNGIGDGLRFAVEAEEEDGSSGSSPRLWNTSPATSPMTATSLVHYQVMSPSSRTQAIARGRRELMEMIRDMPESFYELSLKDIVEQKAAIGQASSYHDNRIADQDKMFAEEAGDALKEKKVSQNSRKVIRKSESKAKMARSGSIKNGGGGMLVRATVFPLFFGAKRNKRSLATVATFNMSPKASASSSSSVVLNGSSVNATEKEWWRKRSCISSESESGGLGSSSGSARSSGSSSRSSSSSGRRRHHSRLLPSCCYFSNEKRITRER